MSDEAAKPPHLAFRVGNSGTDEGAWGLRGVPAEDECASEPIHQPGAIQPHGALIVVDPADHIVIQASANLCAVFGQAAADVLGRRAADVFGHAAWHRIEAMLDPRAAGRVVAQPAVMADGSGVAGSGLAASATRSPCGRICVELERCSLAPDGSLRTETFLPFAQSVLAALRGSRSTTELCNVAARELRRLSGHDRAMVYRFDPDGHGEVVAEDRRLDLESYLGLHYPAGDIPAQARRMYLAQRVRAVPDVGYAPVSLLLHPGRGGPPLDMTLCTLRSMSPVHRAYLTNMGVAASLAVSITGPAGTLWGMLVCHNTAPLAVPPEIRALADLIGQVVSVLLSSVADTEALAAQLVRERHLRAVATALADPDRSMAEAVVAAGAELLQATQAAGLVARIGGRVVRVGEAPPDAAALAIIDALSAAQEGGLAHTDELGACLLPETAAQTQAAGALVLPLPQGVGGAIGWFRPEVAATVTWGGDPYQPLDRDPATGRLSPRRSFAAWQEQVGGRSLPWAPVDLAAALEVRGMLGDAFLRRAEAELAQLRHRDPLTGLPNRRLLQERLDALSHTQGAGVPSRTGLVYIDLDRFKDVNDTLGHGAGDTLLVQIAARLAASQDPSFLLARIGGDEFAILCEDVTEDEAEAAANRVRDALARPVELGGRPYRATASVGIAHSKTVGRAGPALLQAADAAMYVAKRGGGNSVARYVEPLRTEVARRFSLEQDLRAALGNRGLGLRLDFQPIVAVTAGGRLVGFEALARWDHPDRGPVPPGEFIPVAEASGLIAELGHWVLETALDEALAWRASLSGRHPIPYIGINASPRQFAAEDFAGRILAALAARALPASALRIEVTEAAIADAPAARQLAELRRAGVRVAIDDFGTGYSSLSYLRRLPADALKLDRSFLPGLSPPADGADPAAALWADEAFLAAIVVVARRAGLDVIAEGVETPEQLRAAVRAGVGDVQGFLLARPMPVPAVRSMLAAFAGGARLPWADITAAVASDGEEPAAQGGSELSFRALVEATAEPAMVIDVGARGSRPRMVCVNPAFERMTGYSANALVGQSIELLYGQDTDQELLSNIVNALHAGRSLLARVVHYDSARMPFLAEIRLVPIRSRGGELTHVIRMHRRLPSGSQGVEPLLQ